MEEITEEQRQRAERNRLAALAKRKATTVMKEHGVMGLFKCRKISPEPQLLPKFRVRLEICSPDSFSITPMPLPPFPYPGDAECLRNLSSWLSFVDPSHYTQNQDGEKASVYKLYHYDMVLKCLKKLEGVEPQEIPWKTFNVVQRFSHSFVDDHWIPCMPEHLSDDDVDALLKKLPKLLSDSLLPFQLDGVRFGLRRGGCCLIADEMGLGKTIQAIAIACCFMNEGPILVVCPAILRYSWADELERWLPILSPTDIHLVFGHKDNPSNLTRCPKVVVISYTMLHRLRKSMLAQEWALLIIDESHHVRCTKKASEPEELRAILDVARKAKRKVLLSGTPSLSRSGGLPAPFIGRPGVLDGCMMVKARYSQSQRNISMISDHRPYDIYNQIDILWPGLLGTNKYEFAKTYCEAIRVQGSQGKAFQDFSRGVRLEELNVLLKQTVMIRRLKEHLLKELPPKRRQIVTLVLTRSDINIAMAAKKAGDVNSKRTRQELQPETSNCSSKDDADVFRNSESSSDSEDESSLKSSMQLSYEELGIAKLSGFHKWLSLHPILTESECERQSDIDNISHKMIIFAHHLKVLDGVQNFICERDIKFVRIDGNTLARDRQSAVQEFRSSSEVKLAIIGITAGGVGIDFSSAQNVVFLELPKCVSELLQDTSDELRWQNLNKSLCRVSSVMNGKYDAVREIAVGRVSSLGDELGCKQFEMSEEANVEDKDVAADSNPDIITDGISENRLETNGDGEDVDIHMVKNTVLNGRLKCCTSEISNNVNKLAESNMFLEPGGDENRSVELIEVDSSGLLPADTLRFELSQFTGRIHLYTCNLGKDSTPRPLFENFRPEELESLNLSAVDATKNRSQNVIKENPVYKDVLKTFVMEWNNLRPIEQKKLFGKPLRCPLSLELCLLQESKYHDSKGLLKGGSRRRVTPLSEISHPLPENAIWKRVPLCNSYGKKEKHYIQAWTIAGEPLCKLCQMPCQGKFSREPVIVDHLFCQSSCMEVYRARTSQCSLREELFKIEHGVCRGCGLDCHKLVRCIKPLSPVRRKEYIRKVAPKIASHKTLLDKLADDPREGNSWHADHIVAVHKGGGECTGYNMRTLCVACHKEVTAAQATERRLARIEDNKRLKRMLRDLKDDCNIEPPNLKEEDDLIVEVPGSAYTESEQKTSTSKSTTTDSEDKSCSINKCLSKENTCTTGTEDKISSSEDIVTESEHRSTFCESIGTKINEGQCPIACLGLLGGQMKVGHFITRVPKNKIGKMAQFILLGLKPDSFSVVGALSACGRTEDLKHGKLVHGMIYRHDLGSESIVGNALVDMYSRNGEIRISQLVFRIMGTKDVVSWTSLLHGFIKCNDLGFARQFFDTMPQRNSVSWTAMITGYVQGGKPIQALEVFQQMKSKSTDLPTATTIVAVLSACADIGALDLGRSIHGYIEKNNLYSDATMNNALMDMYVKSGSLATAEKIFKEIDIKDKFSWTTMISGFAVHGCGSDAVQVFSDMLRSGVDPNEVTFVALLSACSHAGLIDEGSKWFDIMSKVYLLEQKIEHYGCMVDLFGRAGRVEEAEHFVKRMQIEPDAVIWRSLLSASLVHGNFRIAESAGKKIIELEPDDDGTIPFCIDLATKPCEVAREAFELSKMNCAKIEVVRKP
ncbi:Pentatricopeptide repeat-containing protein [Thalictrum thalictroides]|uniref:Pentatricopeptide repeat-containing protein n=1 Tax=Thalictrum thalictroides TaxID=46969 RepID=A0A7J6VSK6_THATH|nr:Pentatricopeptide repeat-containing protein [Thalictrum thalictroides]